MLDHVKQAVLVNGWVGPSCSPSVSLLDLQVGQGCLALLFATSEGTGPAELGLGGFKLLLLIGVWQTMTDRSFLLSVCHVLVMC